MSACHVPVSSTGVLGWLVDGVPPPFLAHSGHGPLVGMTQLELPLLLLPELLPPVAQAGHGPLGGMTQLPPPLVVLPPVAQAGHGPLDGITQPLLPVVAMLPPVAQLGHGPDGGITQLLLDCASGAAFAGCGASSSMPTVVKLNTKKRIDFERWNMAFTYREGGVVGPRHLVGLQRTWM